MLLIINGLTIVFVIVILVIAYMLGRQISKANVFLEAWKDGYNLDTLTDNYHNLSKLINKYSESIRINCGNGIFKSPEKSEDYFQKSQILRCIGVNPNLMQSAPNLISGLGVLGTFFGLAVSVMFFDNEDSKAIMQSIRTLLGGMGTAFVTSIVGMIASSIYIWKEKKMNNKLSIKVDNYCKELDSSYYISVAEISRMDSNAQKNELLEEIQKVREEYNAKTEELKNIFVSKDDEGFLVKPGNLLLDIYEESTKQSQALSSFTTDLSNQLNSSLVKSMDSSIVPLIKDIEVTHKNLIMKVESLGNNLNNPATDLVGNVVSELKNSMGQLVSEFKQGITEETSDKMSLLATRLSETGEYLSSIPKSMEQMTKNMSERIGDMQALVQNLQASAAKISEETMKNMSGQVSNMTNNFASAVNGLQDQQQAIIEQNRKANDTAIERMKGQFDEIMISFKAFAENLEGQHADLIGRQSSSIKEVERMLGSFNSSIELLRTSNNETGITLSKLKEVSSAIDISSSNLKSLAATMASTAEDLAKQQDERMNEFKAIQESNTKLIEEIELSTSKARDLMKTYTSEYPIIKDGLVDIFNKIAEGLQEYSKTLRASTSDALSEYATALEKSTKALQNIALNLNDTAEELTDGIENFKLKIK